MLTHSHVWYCHCIGVILNAEMGDRGPALPWFSRGQSAEVSANSQQTSGKLLSLPKSWKWKMGPSKTSFLPSRVFFSSSMTYGRNGNSSQLYLAKLRWFSKKNRWWVLTSTWGVKRDSKFTNVIRGESSQLSQDFSATKCKQYTI